MGTGEQPNLAQKLLSSALRKFHNPLPAGSLPKPSPAPACHPGQSLQEGCS